MNHPQRITPSCSTMRLLAVSCALCFALCPSSQAEEAKKSDGHDVIFLADSRPVLVRLHVQMNGKPLLEAWNGFIDELFAKLDTNKDRTLDKAEAARIPAPYEIFSGTQQFAIVRPPLAPGGVASIPADANKDGKVTRDELAAYYRANGGNPFNLGRGSGNDTRIRRAAVDFYGQISSQGGAEELNKALFAALDTNKDGKLSRKELAAASTLLLKKDIDDDEMVTSTELRGEAAVNTGFYTIVTDGSDALNPLGDAPLLEVRQGDASFGRSLAKTLATRYGRTVETKKEGKLTAKDLGLDEATFKKLDADQDGKLDAEELGRFARRAPDLEVVLSLSGTEGVEVKKIGGKPEFPGLKKESATSLTLQIGNTVLGFNLGGAAQSGFMVAPPVADTDAFYKMQFTNADGDSNGYLDETEARRNPYFGNTFKAMDADGDGKLYLKEVLAFFASRKELRDKANGVCVSLALSDQGKGLFDYLDTDKDGRLSLRELKNAPQLLAQLDGDKDDALGLAEVPRRFQLSARRGGSASDGSFRTVAFAGLPGTGRPAPATTKGPLWFRKMDRNRDNDVSRREFLGTDEQFRAIDTDGDGLISVKEADTFDEKMRNKS